MLEARTPEEMEDEKDGRAEEGDEGTENEKKVNQWLIDDVVKDLVEMELNQRKKEGDEEGFKENYNTKQTNGNFQGGARVHLRFGV